MVDIKLDKLVEEIFWYNSKYNIRYNSRYIISYTNT